MRRLDIHVESLVLAGLHPDAVPALLRAAERMLGELLAGRTTAVDPGDPAGALALALADAVRDALRGRA